MSSTDTITPTPTYYHLNSDDFLAIYEPAEDTFLLLDSLDTEKRTIHQLRPTICLEVGSGSGLCCTFLAKLLPPNSAFFICTDINERAALATYKTGLENNIILECIHTDLIYGLSERLHGKVDVLICNPPYVVTEDSEVGRTGIAAAWAGGTKGRVVIDRLLGLVEHLLSDDGLFYLLMIKENMPDEVASILVHQGFSATTILSRRTGMEKLTVMRFTREKACIS